jgi:hypothetical protein
LGALVAFFVRHGGKLLSRLILQCHLLNTFNLIDKVRCLIFILMLIALVSGCRERSGDKQARVSRTTAIATPNAAPMSRPETTADRIYSALVKMRISADFLPVETQFLLSVQTSGPQYFRDALVSCPPFDDDSVTNSPAKLNDSDYRQITDFLDLPRVRLPLPTGLKGREFPDVKVIIIEDAQLFSSTQKTNRAFFGTLRLFVKRRGDEWKSYGTFSILR